MYKFKWVSRVAQRSKKETYSRIAPIVTMSSIMTTTTEDMASTAMDKKCAVCGDRAPYFFYGARACDSGRTFFRRHVMYNN